MRAYTIYDLGMNIDGEKFILPFDLSTPNEGILEKTRDLFIEKNQNVEIDEKWDDIKISCLYEGYDGYYSYEIILKVFRLKYDDKKRIYNQDNTEVQNGQLMVALYVQAEELLRELIDIKVLPNVIEKAGLKMYKYWL